MMTREEAIKLLKQYQGYEPMFPDGETLKHAFDLTDETVDTLLSALRPVSREQGEKVWRGCEACKNAGLAIGEVQFYGPFEGSIDVSGNMQYCPNCGRPITPAAKEEQLERMEALKDGSTTD